MTPQPQRNEECTEARGKLSRLRGEVRSFSGDSIGSMRGRFHEGEGIGVLRGEVEHEEKGGGR